MPVGGIRRARHEGDPRISTPARVLTGRSWIRGRLQPVDVALDDDGRIQRVARTIRGGDRTDFGDRILLPAATDLHVHLREPGGPHAAEGFRSGTEAAALGGVGVVADMPNTEPPIASGSALREKAGRTPGHLAVDVVLYGLVTTPDRLPELGRAAGALKLFLSPTTGVAEGPSPATLPALLAAVAGTGLPLTVHAEDPGAFAGPPSVSTVAGWDVHRPAGAEERALDQLAPLPPTLRLHLAHVTTAEMVRRLRSMGTSFEVTPQHLLLSARSVSDGRLKVNPPLRTEAVRAALWAAFAAGEIPCIASDHAPHPRAAKERPFPDAPSGMPGVETTVPLLLEKVRAGELALDTLLRTACDRPARWLGLDVGRLAPGHRGNLLVVDFKARARIQADRLRTACGWSAFEGWPAIFPSHHFRDGELLVEDGAFVGRSRGRVLRPDYLGFTPSPPD